MSYHMAARYSRPDSSIMINVDHSSCLALGGTFEPCYILTISTVPSQMQATTNKRNAALIQSFMADILSVPPERGIVKFVPIPEENYAFNGNTLFGEIERLEQQQLGNGGVKRAIIDVRKSMPAFKRSLPKIDADFAKNSDQTNGINGNHGHTSNGLTPAPLNPNAHIPDVFELASPKDEERPSTAHASPSNNSFAALNGLRLNGVTKDDISGPTSKTSFGRPKTIAGGPVWASSERFDLIPRRGSSGNTNNNDDDDATPPPILKSDAKQTVKRQDSPRKSPLPPRSASSTPVQKPAPLSTSNADKTKPAYLENASPKPALVKNHSRKDSRSPEALPQSQPQDDGTAANTAKRRSNANVTAVPKVPPPPPVPESKTAKVSKRKSFLAAFKR